MQKLVLKIYIKGKRRPLCEIDIPNETFVEEHLIKKLNERQYVIQLGLVAFARDEFRYYTLEYK